MDQSVHTRWGIAGGTIASVLANLNVRDLALTAMTAAIGAMVSYLVSRLMRRIFERIKK